MTLALLSDEAGEWFSEAGQMVNMDCLNGQAIFTLSVFGLICGFICPLSNPINRGVPTDVRFKSQA